MMAAVLTPSAPAEWVFSGWRSASSGSAVGSLSVRSRVRVPRSRPSSRSPGRGPRALMKKIKILLADDHTLIRGGLRLLVEQQRDLAACGAARDGSAWGA